MSSFEKLEEKISSYKKKYDSSKNKSAPQENSFVITELIASFAVGGFLGYHLDQYFNTKILFMFLFIVLGLISSLYSIYKKYK